MREEKRFIGLELAGAKNQKTSVAVIEYYPQAQKIFLRDLFDKITPHDAHQSPDEALVELILSFKPSLSQVGVNVPFSLPACITCQRKDCPYPPHCTVSEVKWMRETLKSAQHDKPHRVKEITPYTQRAAEIWIRTHVLPHLPEESAFEIDEALGGNKAPLTARMNFLTRHLQGVECLEVWPKLSVAILAELTSISPRVISSYRHLETGAESREEILSTWVEDQQIFIYDRDFKKLCQSLPAFDSFVCAYTALLSFLGKCQKPPRGFPSHASWVHFPKLNEE
ncbi:MAG: hypothetical protein ACO3A2_06825 [Bdellovibrionia bacterium]